MEGEEEGESGGTVMVSFLAKQRNNDDFRLKNGDFIH